jgi:hypothetical protein
MEEHRVLNLRKLFVAFSINRSVGIYIRYHF